MYFKLLKTMAMNYDHTNSLNTTVGSSTNDRNEPGSVSNHLVEATSTHYSKELGMGAP
ncbi:hypothetical protein OKW41_003697 [Paraburkholderia sp. UCT70]